MKKIINLEASENNLRVSVDKLRRRCKPEEFNFSCTTEVMPLKDFIGQERAVKAMQFGLVMRAPGYNLYLAGPTGTGKSTYAEEVLKQIAKDGPVPDDWCCLHNFTNPSQPVAVSFPSGQGLIFKNDMQELINDFQNSLPKAFEGADYEQNKQAILNSAEQQIQQSLDKMRQEALDAGFNLKYGPSGFVFIPLKDNKPLSQEEFEAMPFEEKSKLEKVALELHHKLEEVLANKRVLEKNAQERIRELDKQIAGYAAAPLVQRLIERYSSFPDIVHFLNNVLEDITSHLEYFKTKDTERSLPFLFPLPDDIFTRYKVNLLVNNAQTKGRPVVIESSPHYYNLFGKTEYRSILGNLITDFTMIKAGAIHRANGGYLVIQTKDILLDPFAWDALKKALKNKQAIVENIGEKYHLTPTVSLRPQPIPLNVKVILIGNHYLYHLLYALDEDFRKFFKVKVDFDTEMPYTPENLNLYAAYIGAVCQKENFKHFDRSGMAELVEFGSRLAGNQNKLSTRFNEVCEIIYEAAAWAEMEGAPLVTAQYVRKAIEERIYRSNRIEEKIQEMIMQEKILVDTEGEVTGQVNGLSIIDMGDYAFARPSRITAKTFMGQEGVVNIERESKMSGNIHSKGILTLVGFLGERFAQDKPLRLSARLTFEQLYEMIEGDSASSAELYALLSALAELPLKQGLAVTGSVNQHGEIQPIGGATEKIEGFYAVCKAKGLNGKQGVIIPYQNIDNLMLKHEVVEAVQKNLFHVYAIKTIEEGISLLTGLPAPSQLINGSYPAGTVYYLVDKKLRTYAEGLAKFGEPKREAAKDESLDKSEAKSEANIL